jgi:hypothetical protein
MGCCAPHRGGGVGSWRSEGGSEVSCGIAVLSWRRCCESPKLDEPERSRACLTWTDEMKRTWQKVFLASLHEDVTVLGDGGVAVGTTAERLALAVAELDRSRVLGS